MVTPTTSPQSSETTALVERLREEPGVMVGGTGAALADQSALVAGRLPLFIGGVRGALLPAAAVRVPLAADRAEGGRDEPAVGRRGLRRDRAVRVRRLLRRADRHRHRHAGRALHPGDDVRDPLRPLDGLRGLPALARAGGVPAPRRHVEGGRRRPGADRARDHRRGGDHGRRLPRVRDQRRGLPEAARDRHGDGDPRRRDDRADGARAGADAADRQGQLVDPALAGPRCCRAWPRRAGAALPVRSPGAGRRSGARTPRSRHR